MSTSQTEHTAIPLDDAVNRCVALREEQRWEESYSLTTEAIGHSKEFSEASQRTQWRLLEEHALAALALDKKDEARTCFDRVLEYELADEDMERTLSNLGWCPEPEQPFKIDWKKYFVGLAFALLTALIFIGPSLIKGCH